MVWCCCLIQGQFARVGPGFVSFLVPSQEGFVPPSLFELNTAAPFASHTRVSRSPALVIPCPCLGILGATLQIVDSGADQDSCFFRDSDGESVEGGHYFEELAVVEAPLSITFFPLFMGGFFPYDLGRRKVCVN